MAQLRARRYGEQVTRGCLQFHWEKNYLFGENMRLRGLWVIVLWQGFHFFDKAIIINNNNNNNSNKWFHHKFSCYICCFKYPAKTTSFSPFHSFLHFIDLFLLKHLLRLFLLYKSLKRWSVMIFPQGIWKKKVSILSHDFVPLQ